MNEHDSENLGGMLTNLGYEEVESPKEADLVVINTCSIRENADKRFFGTLGQLKKFKEKNPGFVACVCGCMAQQEHIVETIQSKYPWVDLIFGTHNIHRFPYLLDQVKARSKGKGFVEVWQGRRDEDSSSTTLPTKRKKYHKGFVNVMYGCNNFCTYCIVPYTRGRDSGGSQGLGC